MNSTYLRNVVQKIPEKNQEAIKTLERVAQEWFAHQEEIQWVVIAPNDEQHKKFPWKLALTIVAGSFAVFYPIWEKQGISSLEILTILALGGFFFYQWKNKEIQYIETYVKIIRPMQKGILIDKDGKISNIKYGELFMLPIFRLPETANQNDEHDPYVSMRKKLQNAIHQETGWRFEDVDAP